MKKTILCLLLTLGLLLLSAAAMAASSDPDNYFFDMMEGNITIEDADTSDMVKVTYGNPQTTTAEFDPQEHEITVGGSISLNPLQLSINTTVPVKIIYQVYIGNNSIPNTISIADNADVTLSLTGTANDVSGTLTQPGIELGSGSKLTIQATEHNNILRVYGISKAILGPDDDEPPATVILNSGTVAIIPDSGSGISGNVNLVINGGQFVANDNNIDVNSLIVTGGELWAGSVSSTKVTYSNLNNYKDQITCEAGILPYSVDYYNKLYVFEKLTLPFDLTISVNKSLTIPDGAGLTIPDGAILTIDNKSTLNISGTVTNYGTLNCSVEELMILENGILNNIGKLSVNAGNLHINKNGILNNQGELIANCTIRNSYNGLKNDGTISGRGQILPTTKKLPLGKPTSLTVKSIENGTVTLSVPANANATAEYSPDGTNWQDSPVFERVDLSAGQTFYARYKANNFFNASGETSITVYPFSLNANGGTIASGKDVGYYIAGQSTPLPTDVKKENYSFAGWYDNEALTGDPVLAIGANDTGLKTFWAKWTPDTYTVTLNTNGGTINSGNLTGYTYGEGATLPTDVTREHYSFEGWYDNEALTGDPVTGIAKDATSEKTFWAKWEPDTYTVTLNTNGGTIGSGNLTGYTYGEGATLPTDVTRAGYKFAGWYDNEALTGDPVTGIAKDATSEKTFWAKWEPDTYTVTLNTNGGTIGSGNLTGYTYGEGATLPTDVTRAGYKFAGWYDNEALTGDPVLAISANDTGIKTFWAKWTPDTYTVTLNTNGGTIGSGNLTGYTHGVGATLPTDVTREHYSFEGWYDNEALNGDIVLAISANDTGIKTFWAKWTPDTYTVTLNTNGGTINSGNLTGYTYGEGATLPTDVTREHYSFEGWYDNEALTGDPVTGIAKDATSEKTFWAKWNPDTYTVTLHTNGGTINSGNLTGYTHGVGATLPTDVTREHYSFEGWYDNEALTGDIVLAIGANDTGIKSFWAKWKPDTYTVTLNTNGGTINSGNLTGYTHGVGATLPTDVTREHYSFAGWYDNSIGAGTPFTEITKDATSPKTFWAKWTPDTYNLTLNANGGTINSGNLTSYTYGEYTLLTTDITRPGYTFGGWFDDETFSGKSYIYLDTTETGDKTLWAYWLPTDFTVTLNVNGGTINSDNLTGYVSGIGATLPTDVTRAGYTFAGWYDNEALTGDPVTVIAKDATGEKTFWAKWRIILTAPAGAIASGEAAFAKLPAVKVPTLVLPDGMTLDASITLRYEKLSTSKENTVVYDIYLVDQDGNRVKLPSACTLCIPYPDGLNQNSQSTYHINILHEMDGGKSEDFDSINGGLELTQQGLCVRVSSLSPFTITWERLPEDDLPQTGDSNHPDLWLALMLASAIALAILLRGRKTA